MQVIQKQITLLGVGNMGEMLLSGWIKHGYPKHLITVMHPRSARTEELHDRYQVHATTDYAEAVQGAEVVVICVKPKSVVELLRAIRPFVIGSVVIISIVAGLSSDFISAKLHHHPEGVALAMPNLPASIGLGTTSLYVDPACSKENQKIVESLFHCLGSCVWVLDQEQFHAITALSGAGPAYFFYWVDALCQAGEAMGLEANMVRQLVADTGYGALALLKQSMGQPFDLCKQVMSKGGVTEAAVRLFDVMEMKTMIQNALLAGQQRSKDLAKENFEDHER